MGWWPWSKRVRSAVRFIRLRQGFGGLVCHSQSDGGELRAKFDSAQTTHDNRRHWANADHLAADAAANPQVRRILRNRARYEVANNSYARGIVLTLANDVIGTGPRLQMLLPAEAPAKAGRECAEAGVNQTGESRAQAQASEGCRGGL